MRVFLSILFTILLGVNSAFSYQLVLPKEKKSLTTNEYALFVGKVENNEDFSINNEKIYIAPNGAFAHSVKLKNGENRIMLKSNFNSLFYKIYKENQVSKGDSKLIEFKKNLFEVKRNNTPLRSTPIDAGMNRLSHLFKGTKLLINGEKGDFYRVYLSKDEEAWISKNSINICNESIDPQFITMENTNYKNASKYSIEFTEKLPYVIKETNDEIIFKVYNSMISDGSVYTINAPKPDKYSYQTSLNDGIYTFKISALPEIQNNLKGLTITLDAGHGGTEKGAIGCLGHQEKDINLKIINDLKKELTALGAKVILTRDSDVNVSLDERVEIAKNNYSDIFISVHLNSIPDVKFNLHKHQGTSVYYYNPNSKDLANSIKKSIVNKLNTRDDGVKTASFEVIRPAEYIGVLVEVAYMINPHDSVLYTKDNFASETATAIADGILNYIKNNK